MDAVLEQAPISGLAVACVETVLEHGRLNVVAFVLLFGRKALDLLPEQICLDVLVLEVAPAGLVLPWDAPASPRSLIRDGFDCLVGIACRNLPEGKSVFIMRYKFPAASTLHLAGLELHVIVPFGKLAVLGTLVGAVGIQVLYSGVGNSLAVLHGILQKMAVGEDRRLDLYGSNDAGLSLLHGLRDVGHISLHLLPVLVAIGCIGIVRGLKAVCLDSFLVTKHSLSVLYGVLFVEQTLQQSLAK